MLGECIGVGSESCFGDMLLKSKKAYEDVTKACVLKNYMFLRTNRRAILEAYFYKRMSMVA